MLQSEMSTEERRVYFRPRNRKPSEAKGDPQNERARSDPPEKGGEKADETETREEHGVIARSRAGAGPHPPPGPLHRRVLRLSCCSPLAFLNALAASSSEDNTPARSHPLVAWGEGGRSEGWVLITCAD